MANRINTMEELLKRKEEILKSVGVKVIDEKCESDIIQTKFETKIGKNKFEIVMQVEKPIVVTDMQGLYNDYMCKRMKNSELIKNINELGIIVNNRNLLNDLISNTGDNIKDLTLSQRGELLNRIIDMFIFFYSFCM